MLSPTRLRFAQFSPVPVRQFYRPPSIPTNTIVRADEFVIRKTSWNAEAEVEIHRDENGVELGRQVHPAGTRATVVESVIDDSHPPHIKGNKITLDLSSAVKITALKDLAELAKLRERFRVRAEEQFKADRAKRGIAESEVGLSYPFINPLARQVAYGKDIIDTHEELEPTFPQVNDEPLESTSYLHSATGHAPALPFKVVGADAAGVGGVPLQIEVTRAKMLNDMLINKSGVMPLIKVVCTDFMCPTLGTKSIRIVHKDEEIGNGIDLAYDKLMTERMHADEESEEMTTWERSFALLEHCSEEFLLENAKLAAKEKRALESIRVQVKKVLATPPAVVQSAPIKKPVAKARKAAVVPKKKSVVRGGDVF